MKILLWLCGLLVMVPLGRPLLGASPCSDPNRVFRGTVALTIMCFGAATVRPELAIG
jgi:hypothetical protein